MSDIIRLLPDSVANQIAAGEVIQRPASVVKELVENAVDAGASVIRIYIRDAGRTLIQVVDNGKGMSETDARMAFERHATSKIKGADDLFCLHTMGFRGEALPSICAVSQVEVKTKTPDANIGTRLEINASKVQTQEAHVCDAGTNISVKNLFFNVPARRKFLKSDSVENSNIMREFERLALVNNNIHMCIDTGGKILDLRPASFKNRIADIWKNQLDLHLVPVDVETSLIKIQGFISRPEYARRRNPLQYLIANGRNMRHPYFHKAIVSCYDSLIASDTQPCYFMKFEVDPSSIDVNIHPTKNEIKFENEQEIWPILHAAVKAALGKNGAMPSIDFQNDPLPVKPLSKGETPFKPVISSPPGYSPFSSNGGSGATTRQESRNGNVPRNWDTLYADFLKESRGFKDNEGISKIDKEGKSKDQIEITLDTTNNTASLPGLEISSGIGVLCIQHADRFIITSGAEGLIIIDQRKAHVKILFEEFLNRFKNEEKTVQQLMFPELLRVDSHQLSVLQDILDDLNKFGFVVVKEEEVWKITTIPGNMKNIDVCHVIYDIIDSILEGGAFDANNSINGKSLSEKMALVMARSSAIPVTRKLSSEEMEHIVSSLFLLPSPMYGPDGHKTYFVMENAKLEGMFR